MKLMAGIQVLVAVLIHLKFEILITHTHTSELTHSERKSETITTLDEMRKTHTYTQSSPSTAAPAARGSLINLLKYLECS